MVTSLIPHFGLALCLILPLAFSQEKFNIAESINKFSVDLLAAVNQEGGDNVNIALSPLTLWTSLTIVSEGAYDSTADQIDAALGQPQNKNTVRDSYQKLTSLLKKSKSKETQFEVSTGIFARIEFPLKEKFSQIAKQYYGVSILPVDFKNNIKEASDVINKHVASATYNRIPHLVSPVDVQEAYLFMTSTMYFRGQWKVPFNKTATKIVPFTSDNPKVTLGEVQLMYQAHPFPYDRRESIKAQVVELPYGLDDTFSMVLFIPRGYQTVTGMLNALTNESFTEILATLQKNHEMYSEDDVHVYLPKFKVSSDFNMERVLERLGVRDVFDSQKANLLGMFSQYLYLSRVIQKAEIEVDEEGTVASAASGSIFINRSPPPMVKADRPFAFFIVHKQSGSIVSAGKISNPNSLN